MSELGELLKPMSQEEKDALISGAPVDGSDSAADASDASDSNAGSAAAPPAEVEFRLDAFNKRFGTQFDKEDAVLDILSKGGKYHEVETAKEQAEREKLELKETLKKTINPRSFFSSDDAYMREQLLLSGKVSEGAIGYLSSLSPSRIDSMKDYEALKYALLINNPELDGGEAGAEELLNDKYNFDGDFEAADRSTKNRILLDAKDARKSLRSMYDGIKIPDVQDWESKVQSHVDSWSNPAKELVNGISELKLSEEYSFVVDPSSKDGLVEEVLDDLVKNQVELTPEALQKAAGDVRTKLMERNMDKIIKHLETVITEKEKEKLRKEIHNDKPLNTDASASGEEDINAAAIKKLLS